jgi:riboflavin transport system substrate-binding protein
MTTRKHVKDRRDSHRDMSGTPRARGLTYAVVMLLLFMLTGCTDDTPLQTHSVVVFVPGVTEGSPTYEMMVEGVQAAVDEHGTSRLRVVEGGFNQAGWPEGITSLAATGEYDLIITSNPSMPEIVAEVASSFPGQRFLVLDGHWEGVPGMYTLLFNQREQAFLTGYFAGLVTTGSLEHSNTDLRIGLLAGQEYPIMNHVIQPAYELGARTVNPNIELDFRVLGNWYDAGRATEMAASMIDRGADVILTIAGGGNQGVLTAAREKGAYVIWYDSPGYDEEPGVVLGSTIVKLDTAAYERTLAALNGDLPFGESEIAGVRDGYVTFDESHRLYEKHVPEEIRSAMSRMLRRMESGEFELEMPTRF